MIAALPDWLMTLNEYFDQSWHLLTAMGVAFAGGRWFVKRAFKSEVRDIIKEEIKPLKDEFKNNGGSSMKDSIDQIKTSIIKVVEHQGEFSESLHGLDDRLESHTRSDDDNFNKIMSALDAQNVVTERNNPTE